MKFFSTQVPALFVVVLMFMQLLCFLAGILFCEVLRQ